MKNAQSFGQDGAVEKGTVVTGIQFTSDKDGIMLPLVAVVFKPLDEDPQLLTIKEFLQHVYNSDGVLVQVDMELPVNTARIVRDSGEVLANNIPVYEFKEALKAIRTGRGADEIRALMISADELKEVVSRSMNQWAEAVKKF